MAHWTTQAIPDQSGRTIVITGANVGLGLESAERLAERGARVLLACRNPARGSAALEAVAAVATGPAPSLVALDLSDLAAVERAADEIAGEVDQIDVLMNNAGVMALPSRQTTAQGLEMQLGVNHVGHFALTLRLLPQLLAAEQARVVALGSMAHLRGQIALDDLQSEHSYSAWGAYNQSKLANMMFMLELDRRAKHAGLPLLSLAAHPGLSNTNLFSAGPKSDGFNPINTLMGLGISIIGQSPQDGALGQLRAATDPDVQGGEYFGPTALGGARGKPVLAPIAGRAFRDGVAEQLWEASEAIVGLRFDDALAAATR